MLTEGQTNRVWQKMIEAEVRSYYFGELVARYSKQKQLITGLSLMLSSGVAATLGAKAPGWIPLVLSAVTAFLTAYSIAVGLDKRAVNMAKLHYEWNHLCSDYERLWNHWYDQDAEQSLGELLKRAREVSEKGTTDAPYEPDLIQKWFEFVNDRYQSVAA